MSSREKKYSIFGEMVTEGINRLAIGKRIGAVQRDLAETLGVAPVTIHSWRQGLHLPDPETTAKLARIFVERGSIDQVWLERFLRQARLDQAERRRIIGELFKGTPPLPVQETRPAEAIDGSTEATRDEPARYVAFGDKLSEGINRLASIRRQKLGETEAQLATDLGYSVQALRAWRRGETRPAQAEIIAKLALRFVDEAKFDEAWMRQFLLAGQYGSPEIVDRLIEELFSPAGKRARHNRARMLDRMEEFWIKGVLKTSLLQAEAIAVPLKTQPQAVPHHLRRAMRRVVRLPDQPDQLLPPDVRIGDVFEKMDRALLILGGPGSGKTTLLLELAQDLLAWAKKDRRQSIPVVFNLSSWAQMSLPLEAWLVEEMSRVYNIPAEVGLNWVEQDQLLLLLDGLDEVVTERRMACIAAINLFLQHHAAPIAICSRLADYEALATQLELAGAVCLQPLASEQVAEYLSMLGPEVAAVQRMHQQDVVWRELAETPLMLNVMIAAYQGEPVEQIESFETVEASRTHLFEAYIKRMFRRVARFEADNYSETQMRRWLTWLAQKMKQNNQTIFLIEQMQPGWLDTAPQRRLYHWLSRLAMMELLGLPFGIILGLLMGLIFNEIFIDTLGQLRPQQIGGFSIWFLAGLLIGQGVGFIASLLLEKWVGGEIKSVETLTWSWSAFRQRFRSRGLIGLGLGSVFGLMIISLGLVVGDVPGGLIYGLYFWIIAGLSFALLLAIIGGFDTDLTLKERQKPNQGMHQSALNALLVGGSSTLASIPVTILTFVLILVLMTILLFIGRATLEGNLGSQELRLILVIVTFLALATFVFGIVSGIFTGLIAGLRLGGLALLRHGILRLILSIFVGLPLKFVTFLDAAAARILLHKVGGGYIFIHRMLLEHFASAGHDE